MTPTLQSESEGRLTMCPTAELKPHPAFSKLGLSCDARKLSALAGQGASAFSDPIVITQELHIVAGYELWQFAQLQHRPSVSCLQFDMSEEASLLRLISSHQRSAGLNDFIRILLALELEEGFRERARANQSRGGKLKVSSNLTEAYPLDVRKEVALAAGVSVGNVSKAKKLIASADPEIIDALKRREITMHRASQWMGLNAGSQRQAYRRYVSERGIKASIRMLISRQRSGKRPVPSGMDRLGEFLRLLRADTRLEQHWGQIESLVRQLDQTDNMEIESSAC